MAKIDRQAIYAKYGGRCAYCGHPIDIKDMQVDHIFPKWRGGTDETDNLNPSCRMCNFYKGGGDVESFRNKMLTMLDYRRTFATRMALRYGILEERQWDGKFYFERLTIK